MIPVGHLAPGNQWDQWMLDLLFSNRLYPTGLEFKRAEGYPPKSGGILICPGRYWYERMPDIEDAVASHAWLLLIRTGDEEDLFDINQFAGPPRTKIWAQTPRTGRDYGDARLFGVGYTPHFTDLPADPPERTTDVFLAAQDTHERRHQAFKALAEIPGRDIITHQSHAFTEGLQPAEYARQMMTTKIAPCPTGPASPDTFRLYEALQAHAIPIADDITLGYSSAGYWCKVFPDAPFPIITDYDSLRGYVGEALRDWPANANRITAWWMCQKRAMAHWLVDDLKALGAL